MGVFTQILKCHKVAALLEFTTLVGDPYFYSSDFHAAAYVWQFRSEIIVVVTEKMGEEKMSVSVVFVGVHRELGGLRATA